MYRAPRANHAIRQVSPYPSATARGYCDRRHFAWRKAVLLRDNYTCRDCGGLCHRKLDAHADHIIAVQDRPDLRYEIANGQCLCAACHARKTGREVAARMAAKER